MTTQYSITLTYPDGRKEAVDFNGPDDLTDDQIESLADGQLKTAKPGETFQHSVYGGEVLEKKAEFDKLSGKAGAEDLLMQGATLGLSDEGAGLGSGMANIITAPFSDEDLDPVGAYQVGRDAQRMRLDEARDATGWSGTAAEVGGSLLSGGIAKGVAAAVPLGRRMIYGAKAGAAGGGIAGFGYGEGGNSILTGVLGAGLGATIGAAFPLAAQVVSNRVGGLKRMFGLDPTLSRRIVSEAMTADNNSPTIAGQMMDSARGRGVPLTLADTGENTRGLLASVSRQPGPARTIAREAVTGRQGAQGERISEAIARDLGPTSNPHQVSDELIAQAREAASPLYERAYQAPGVSSPRIEQLLQRPAMRQAMGRAQRIAAEEGRDPTSLGFDLDAQGEVILTREPSMQTLDYVKRGMDDVIETFRNPVNGRLVLDESGRAINSTQRSFLAELDRVNPAYAEARAAYAGPAAANEAMRKGLKAIGKTADDITAQTQRMTPYQLDFYRLGVRRAMSDLVASKTDGSNKVAALLGTVKKRLALQRLFGGREEFQNFLATLNDEQAAQTTYQSVIGGSQTAERGAFDATTNDTGLAETAMDAALRGGKDGAWSAAVAAIQRLKDVDRMGAGQAGERTRESIAALLSETDPTVLRDLMAAIRTATVQQGIRTGNQSRIAVGVGRNIGDLSGMATGKVSEPRR